MGFFRSLWRLISTCFGLFEGGTQRATDTLLTSSPDAIRNQFRKTREDMVRDYEQMKAAIAELMTIRDGRAKELAALNEEVAKYDAAMTQAVETFKRTQNENARAVYAALAEKKEGADTEIDRLEAEVATQDQTIAAYKGKLQELQESIANLKREEAETVADIVSSKKLAELNAKLEGLSTDTQTKNLEAIREARSKAKSQAKLSRELAGPSELQKASKELLAAGAQAKHLAAFEAEVGLERIVTAKPLELPSAEKAGVEVKKLDKLFSE